MKKMTWGEIQEQPGGTRWSAQGSLGVKKPGMNCDWRSTLLHITKQTEMPNLFITVESQLENSVRARNPPSWVMSRTGTVASHLHSSAVQ